MRYKPYPKYKESGVAWLGEVPEHWEKVSLKWISKIYSGGTPDKKNIKYWENGTIPWINSGSVNQFLILEPSKYITKEALKNSSAKWIPKEALVMALAGQGKTKGMVAQLGISTTCNQSMSAIIPNKLVYNRFLFWWITSNYQRIRNMSGGDLRDGLNLEILGNIPCPFLNLNEQKSIANYLDQKTQKIDTLIEKQQTLIKLLKEKRQALISHAVTKGLDDTVKMKDSGVAWLGDVPEGWIVTRLKYLTRLIIDGAHFTPTYVDDGIPFLRVTDLHNQIIDKEKTKYIPLSEHKELIKRCNPKRGDLLLSKNGTIGLTKIIDWDWDFSIFVSLCLIKFRIDKLKAEYFSYIFQSSIIEEQLTNSTKKTSVMNLHLDKINELYFIVPSILEQEEIISYLDQKTNQIDTLISKSTQAIELLKERRSALISAVVTGKVDVRNDDRGEENEL